MANIPLEILLDNKDIKYFLCPNCNNPIIKSKTASIMEILPTIKCEVCGMEIIVKE